MPYKIVAGDNGDAVEEVRKTVARAEQKIILDAARKRLE